MNKKIKYKGEKMKIHKPKSVKEAIDDFQVFLECDLYSKFRPEQIIPLSSPKNKEKKLTFYREDFFINEREFLKYLETHLNILRKEIIGIIGNNKFKKSVKR